MVAPPATKLLYAVIAAADQVDCAAFVPPARPRAVTAAPLASIETKMFSID